MSYSILFQNFREYMEHGRTDNGYEVGLYSDSTFVGEYRTDLISIINTINHASKQDFWKRLVLRYFDSNTSDELRGKRRETISGLKNYHGGDETDEICALISLILTVRIKSGRMERSFGTSAYGDPLGRPVGYFGDMAPSFARDDPKILRVPFANREYIDLGALSFMLSFPFLNGEMALRLVLAARLHQEALWICENRPSIAWLQLVSAADLVGKFLYPSVGHSEAAARFITNFAPNPPSHRSTVYQLDFTNLHRLSKIVYDIRSTALHSGIEFPFPMCSFPDRFYDGSVTEIPTGLATKLLQSEWNHESCPMLLWMYFFLVRGALLNWWLNEAKLAGYAGVESLVDPTKPVL